MFFFWARELPQGWGKGWSPRMKNLTEICCRNFTGGFVKYNESDRLPLPLSMTPPEKTHRNLLNFFEVIFEGKSFPPMFGNPALWVFLGRGLTDRGLSHTPNSHLKPLIWPIIETRFLTCSSFSHGCPPSFTPPQIACVFLCFF